MSSVEFSTTLIGSPRDGLGAAGQQQNGPPGDLRCRVPGPLARFNYRLSRLAGQLVFLCTMKVESVRLEAADRPGGYVLAASHLSHLDPICLGVILRRKVDWMARIEFYRNRVAAAALWALDAFPVNRFGRPVRAIRTAVHRAAAGRVVGIFPDGGVGRGATSICRGGAMKKGACVVAQRAGVPIIPCVILGSHALNRVRPWLPTRSGRLWVIFGSPIFPKSGLPRRQARDAMAAEVQMAFVSLYGELCAKYGIDDAEIP